MTLDPSMSLLVVDDHDPRIQIIRTMLRKIGFVDVDDAGNGAEALTKMRVKRYGLVISDWHMEPMNGHDLLREVRSDPTLKRTPFIATGKSEPENVIAAKKAGVNNYIVRPFDAEALKAKIVAVFATRTAPLPERQVAAVSKPPQVGKAPNEKPAADVMPRKFPGLFTSNS
jgi:two-component system chemotaxis response regulator CheY